MSEKDNLPKADGKEEVNTLKNKDATVNLETVVEDKTKSISEEQEETILNIEEATEVKAENDIEEVVEKTIIEAE
ncbi:MAG: hypothetical protein IMY67_11800, partial [Bacteroidetes bacterium]|nr:hypothetical protein [Bacteroidota bacterium]